jgi:acid phosphatase (class A)
MGWKLTVAVAATAAAMLTMGADPAPAPKPLPPPPQPYLTGAMSPDTYRILPPAPLPGTARYEADRKMFLGTRSLKDSPRWALALNDDNIGLLRKDLSCAVGVELTDQNAPRFSALMRRVGRDSSNLTNLPKDQFKRLRPFLVDKGPICIDPEGGIAKSFDYPSGHVTYSWTVGLILAELAPDRATDILIRARAYGESRLICGVHNMSAVESGRTNASAIVASLHGQPEFRSDMEAVRSEIAAARKAGPAPDAATCAKDAELLKSPY